MKKTLFLLTFLLLSIFSVRQTFADFGPDTFTAPDGTALQNYNSVYHLGPYGYNLYIQSNQLGSNGDPNAWHWLDYSLPQNFQIDWDWVGGDTGGTGTRWYVINNTGDIFGSTRFGFLIYANSNGSGEVKWADENDTRTTLATLSTGTINIGTNNTMKILNEDGYISFYLNGNQIGSNVTLPVSYDANWKLLFVPRAGTVDNLKITDIVESATITASPSSGSITVGTPFSVDVVVDGAGNVFNAAQATVTVSSNLTLTNISTPSSNACNFSYTQTPTTSNPSFAGVIFGTSTTTNCKVYRLTLIPATTGTGTITFSNASIKSYADSSELLSAGNVQNGSFTINAASPTPTPPGTSLVTVDDSVQGSNQNQWSYVGSGWNHCTDSSNPACNPSSIYNTSVSWSNTTNDYATISFTGIRVSLYGLVDPNHGIGAVSIDGGTESNVDFSAATRQGDVLLWTSPLLTQGQHTLKVRVSTGSYIAIDRADILETTPFNLTITNTILDTYNSSYTLTGTKDSAITSVFVNGSSANSTYPTSTTWQAVAAVALGNNTFNVYGTDVNGNQTASVSVTVNRHTLGDINGDGVVDLVDASLLAVDYGKTGNFTSPLSDMNGDGVVNLTDFSILAKLVQ